MDDKNWCVYIHINKINNKKYIGITSNYQKRWSGEGRNYREQPFGKAIQKYGWDNFEHLIVYDDLTKQEACIYEQTLIQVYNTTNRDYGYNCSLGGDSGSYGVYDVQFKKMIPVYQYDNDGNFIKSHISIAAAVRNLKPGYTGRNCFNIPSCCQGKRQTALGYRWFYEFKGSKIDPIKTPTERTVEAKSKKVYQYSFNGDFICEYKSVVEAVKITGFKGIQQCASGITKSAGGYCWFYDYLGNKIKPYKRTA